MLHTTDKIIEHKVGLLNLAEELGNVSKACQVMGLSRDIFYRYKQAVDDGGVEALFERTRRWPNLANRVEPKTEEGSLSRLSTFRPMARCEPPMSYASRACLSRHRACVPFGCATTWRTSRNV